MKASAKALLSISIAATCIVLLLVFSLAWFSASNPNVHATQAVFTAGSAGETVGEMTLGGIMNLVEDGQYSGQTGEYYYYYVLTDNDPAYTYIDTDPDTEGTQYLTDTFDAYLINAHIFLTRQYVGISSTVLGELTTINNSDGTVTVIDNSGSNPYYSVMNGASILYTEDPEKTEQAMYPVSTISVDLSGTYPCLEVRYLDRTEVKTSYALYTQYEFTAVSESTRAVINFDGISTETDDESGVVTVTNRDGSYTVITPDGENVIAEVFAENGALLFADSALDGVTVTVDESENPNTKVVRLGAPLTEATYIRSYTGVSDVVDDNVRTIVNSDGTVTTVTSYDENGDGVYDYSEYDIMDGDAVLFHQRRGTEGTFKISIIESGEHPVTVVDSGDKLKLAKYRILTNSNGTRTYYNTLSPFDYLLYDAGGELLASYSRGDVSATTITLEEEHGETRTLVELAGRVIEGEKVLYKHYEQVGQRQYVTNTIGIYNDATSSYDYVLYDRYGSPKYDDCEIEIQPTEITAYAVTNSSQNDEAYKYTKEFTVKIVVPEDRMFNLYCTALSIGLVGEYELDLDDADLKTVGRAYCTYITITNEDESVDKIYLFGLEKDTVITDDGEGTVTYVVKNYDNSITTAVYVNNVLTTLTVKGGADPENLYDYSLEDTNVTLLFRTDRNIYYVHPETLLRDFHWELTLSVDGGYSAITDSEEDLNAYAAWLNGEESAEVFYKIGLDGYEVTNEATDWLRYYYCEFTVAPGYVAGTEYYRMSDGIYYMLEINSQSDFDYATIAYGDIYLLSGGSVTNSLTTNDYYRVYRGTGLYTRDIAENGLPYYLPPVSSEFEALRLYRKNPDYPETFYPGADGKLVDENGTPFLLSETRIFEESTLTLYFLDGNSLESLKHVGYGFDFNKGHYVVNSSEVVPFNYSAIEFMGTRFVLEFDVYGGQAYNVGE